MVASIYVYGKCNVNVEHLIEMNFFHKIGRNLNIWSATSVVPMHFCRTMSLPKTIFARGLGENQQVAVAL